MWNFSQLYFSNPAVKHFIFHPVGVMESEIIKREDYAHFKCYDYLKKIFSMLAMVDSLVQKLIIQIICVLLYILNIKASCVIL